MAYDFNEFGRSIAVPGMVIPNQPSNVESRCMMEDKDSEGGFPVFGKIGEDQAGYAVKPGEGGYFIGVAERMVVRDAYPKGTPVSVVTSGVIYVQVATDVKSGEEAGVNADGGWGVKGGDGIEAIAGAKYRTSASAGSLAQLILK